MLIFIAAYMCSCVWEREKEREKLAASLAELILFYELHEMASVASQLIEEVTAHAQSDSLEHAREICADGTYFLNNLRT